MVDIVQNVMSSRNLHLKIAKKEIRKTSISADIGAFKIG
jgi:hypothetical protein